MTEVFDQVIHYSYSPAPRANPDGELDGAWIVRNSSGRIVARFHGRDKCEAWLHRRRSKRQQAALAKNILETL